MPGQVQIEFQIGQFQMVKQDLEAALRAVEHHERQEIKEFREVRQPNPGLLKCIAYLGPVDREMSEEFVEPVRYEEPKLQVLCKALESMIQGSQYTAVQEIVGCKL